MVPLPRYSFYLRSFEIEPGGPAIHRLSRLPSPAGQGAALQPRSGRTPTQGSFRETPGSGSPPLSAIPVTQPWGEGGSTLRPHVETTLHTSVSSCAISAAASLLLLGFLAQLPSPCYRVSHGGRPQTETLRFFMPCFAQRYDLPHGELVSCTSRVALNLLFHCCSHT